MRKNYLIVFCGMDGTGKTTLAKKVGEYLQKNNIVFQYNHAHGYAMSQNSMAINDKQINRFRFLLRFFTPFLILDNMVNYLINFRPIFTKKILICDRYFYDKIARQLFYGVIGKTVARIYLSILPKPHLVFFLDIDPKIAFERKKEYSLKDYQRFQQMYRFVANTLNMPLINTNESQSKTSGYVINQVQKLLEE